MNQTNKKILGLTFSLFSGILSIVLGLVVLTQPGFGEFALIVFLAIGLLFAGGRSITMGYSEKESSKGFKLTRIGIGILSILLAITVMMAPGIGLDTLVILLAVALIVQGIGRISRGIQDKELSGVMRSLYGLAGLVTIGLSTVVLCNPGFGISVLILLIAIALIINGFSSISLGINKLYE